jgi:FkbM family methyltransferase
MALLRPLKRLAALALPEWVKAPLRGRLYGYRASRVSLPFTTRPLPNGTHRLEIEGLRPLVVPQPTFDAFAFHLTTNGESIEELHSFLRHAAAADGTLFDVGANHGAFSLAFCAARDGNRAIAFEPAEPPLALLSSAATDSGVSGRIEPVHAWIGDSEGETSGGIDASGFFNPGVSAGARTVLVTTLDAYAARTGTSPTLLKIDVDGAELDVLRGAARILREARPIVFLEIHHDLLEKDGVAPADVVAALVDAGYRFETPLGKPLTDRAVSNAATAVMRVVGIPPTRIFQ